MPRRVMTLVLSTVLVLVMLLVGGQMNVPYVGLGPGPTYNTLGNDSKGAPLIQVTGRTSYPTTGHLNLVTVSVSGGPHYPMDLGKALRYLFDKHVELVPENEIFPPGQTSEQVVKEDNKQMAESQSSAQVAALNELGIAPTGVQVFEVVAKSPSEHLLSPGDHIVGVDGTKATDQPTILKLLRAHKVGDTVRIGITTTAGQAKTVSIVTAASTDKPVHPVIGVSLQPSWPFTVSIHVDSVGGPSAGMMFALGLIDKLTPGDLTGGTFIAGTGEISDDGTVSPIGGITQKMYGVRKAGAQYFLAPSENCGDVVKGGVPKGLQVVKVTKLHDALADVKAIAAGQVSNLPPCTAG